MTGARCSCCYGTGILYTQVAQTVVRHECPACEGTGRMP